MRLDNTLRKQFFHALLSAFPQVDDLAMFVDFELGQNLEQIVGDATGKAVAYKLIVWCETNGRLKDLIEAAARERAQNPDLCQFMVCFQQITVSSVAQGSIEAISFRSTRPTEPRRQSFPETCHFDLNFLIQECREAIYGKTGLVGLIIPCSESSFQEHFCERLKQDLGRKVTKKRSPLAIDVNISAEQVVSRVRGFKRDLLKDYDVICPLPIHIAQPDSTLPDTIWQALLEEFQQTEIKRRLIIVMFGGAKTVFPDGPTHIEPPQFKEVDVHYWIAGVVKVLEWPEQALERWKTGVVRDCWSDSTCKALEIWKVYERLELSLRLLQSHRVADDFLRELASELEPTGRYHV